MNDTVKLTPSQALMANTNELLGELPTNLIKRNKKLQQAIEETKTAAKYSIASSVAAIFEAQAGVEAITSMKTQYNASKSLINRNIATTQTVMMQNLEDRMAQLDAVTAAKNVDIRSQAVRFVKEKALMNIGQDFADMEMQGSLQKAALDLQHKMEVTAAKSARSKTLFKSIGKIIESAEYLL